MPSSRTDEDLQDTHFKTAQEALDFWEQCQPAHGESPRPEGRGFFFF